MRYTYSRWDGSQSSVLNADDLLDALSDDLLADGNLSNAVQRIMRWGLPSDGGQQLPGLQALLQRLRAQRQRELERYDPESLLRDIQERIEAILQSERDGIERRLGEADRDAADQDALRSLETVAQHKADVLDSVPPQPAEAIAALADYEFLDDWARAQFEELKRSLQEQALRRYFQGVQQAVENLDGSAIQSMESMLQDLNTMMEQRLDGQEPDFSGFMQRHGRFFPGAGSLDQLVEGMHESAATVDGLMSSMSAEMRDSLDDLLSSVMESEGMREGLERLGRNLQSIAPSTSQPRYPFSGTESLTLDAALRVLGRIHDLDALERELRRAQDEGDLHDVDPADVARLMGNDAGSVIDGLQDITDVLQAAGYVERGERGLVLTARGVRRIGQKALEDIFRNLKHDSFGKHALEVSGAGSERIDEHKAYEFGDPFLLDLQGTMMNALFRGGAGSPVSLELADFQVFRTEQMSRASTVLMLDMSRSMPLRGCFVAAKKVALALDSLIRSQFPSDNLYIVGFSDFARQLRPESLHQITWGDYVYGTNMQHGFLLARRLLGREKSGNKQIILITDGEPTAHFEGDRVHFSYPPTFRTFQETLREVKRCTQEGIVINTFMLERSHYLADFVNQMTRINRGRAFFATPERLGDYILVDYVAARSRRGHPASGRMPS